MTQRSAWFRAAALVTALFAVMFVTSMVSAEEKGASTGTLDRFTKKFNTFCIITEKGPEIYTFTDSTQYKNTEAKGIADVQPGSALDVSYTVKDGKKIADVVALKIAKVAPEELIKTDEVAALIEKGLDKAKAMIFDSRPEVRFEQGRLPGAISLPFYKWDELKDKLLPKDKDTLLIFYCQGVTCSLSPKSADAAKKMGYKNVKVYQDGIPGWLEAGKTAFTDIPTLKKFVAEMEKKPDAAPFFVLLDTRSGDDIAKGFIPLATAMKAEDLEKAAEDLPKFKGAQIIIYSQNGPTPEALKVFKALQDLKYVNTAILDGGFDAWKKAEGKLASGKPFDKIKFTRKVNKDEISVVEFKAILDKPAADKLLVDVRPPEEFSQGAIAGAKSIPLEVMQKDLSDLPKDKEIITYCNTGAICSIADKVLKGAGYKSRYLNANITYKDGKPVIAE